MGFAACSLPPFNDHPLDAGAVSAPVDDRVDAVVPGGDAPPDVAVPPGVAAAPGADASAPDADASAPDVALSPEVDPAGACRIEFRPGIYELNTMVILRSNLTIRCLSSGGATVTFRRGRGVDGAGHFLYAQLSGYISGNDVTIRDNRFESLLLGGSPDPWRLGTLNLVGAALARSDGSFGTSTNITLTRNTFIAPGTSDAMPLSALSLDRGVSGVTLVDDHFNGPRYDCAVRVLPNGRGLPDGGAVVAESGSVRNPTAMPARCR